ncbi:MAG: biosynthetic peptidoglycan transglycosylase [Veillonella sp.]|nr:biosynthetic peptidoglycan transglycosylase [Veillonella sp.]
MFIFRMVRRLVLIICIVLGAIYVYDTYQSYQGTNRVSKAHTTVEQTIEENEDTLSRWERMHRIFTFREKVEAALHQRVPRDKWVKSENIPDNAKRALVAIEDKRYYKHGAIDVLGVTRAFYVNSVAGETVEGGSTITQQLVKNLFLSSKEHYYSKDEILTMYLNTVYYGHNYYGIKEAAEGYFGTSPSRLTLGQCAMLAALPNAPTYLDPYENYKGAKARQKLVLAQMVDQGMISQAEADYAYKQELGIE